LALTLSCLTAAAFIVQSPPDFSGTWQIDLSQSASPGGGTGGGSGRGNSMGGGLGMGPSPTQLTIRQDATTLTIEQRGSAVSKLVYKLDGSETKNPVAAGPTGRRDGRFKSVWRGAKLVTSIATTAPRGGAVTYQEERYLDAIGAMVVETFLPGEGRARKVVYQRIK
jgi:hypothetical protein